MKNEEKECRIIPMGAFGDHDKGLSGCVWCEQQEACIKHNPHKGGSLIFDKFNKPDKPKKFRRRAT